MIESYYRTLPTTKLIPCYLYEEIYLIFPSDSITPIRFPNWSFLGPERKNILY